MRWVRKDRRIYDHSCCILCGTGWGGFPKRRCPHSVCKACGSVQCLVNGLGHGTCGICTIGFLPGWSGNDRSCGYAGCTAPAIAEAPRVGAVCADHAQRAKYSRDQTVAQWIAACLARRAEHWEEVAD